MGTAFRLIAIVVEVVILMAVIYALFSAVMLTSLDFGLDQKYKKYIGRVMTILPAIFIVVLALVLAVILAAVLLPIVSMETGVPV